ncbi:MAG: hypothetical protein JNL12_01555 [Planctomycetes bacterium]|nr:hypothetical protein [Planctomycetota bacterium]
MQVHARVFALLLTFFLFAACGGADAKAGEQADPPAGKVADNVAAVGKVKALTDTLQGMLQSLDGLQDPAAAERAKAGLDAQLGKLKDLVGQLDASQLGDLWTKAKAGAQKVADEQLPKLVAKYQANPELQKAVAPYLEELKSLFAGK